MQQFFSKWFWAFAFGLPAIFIILWMTAGEYVSPAVSAIFAVLGFGGFVAAFALLVSKSGRGDK